MSVVKLQKSGGVVARSPALRKTARAERTREYFYGVRGDLQPQAQTARFDELQIYRIGSGPKPSANALPIGAGPERRPHLQGARACRLSLSAAGRCSVGGRASLDQVT